MVEIDDVDNECIVFKSTNENWQKETGNSDRIKNNTVRCIQKQEMGMLGLEWDENQNWLYLERPDEDGLVPIFYPILYIKIINRDTGNSKKYNITDITKFDENTFVFTFDLFYNWKQGIRYQLAQHGAISKT